jgi:hypothetical protein
MISERLAISIGCNGAPEEIRTPDPQIRSLVLYPAELRARRDRIAKGEDGRRSPVKPAGEWRAN